MSNKYPGGIITSGANAGYSVAFDGTGDYLTVANNTALQMGTGDFQVEAWVYTTNASAFQSIICIGISTGGSTAGTFTLRVQNDLKVRWCINDNSTGLTSTNAITVNTWTHVCVSRVSGTTRIFLNGVSNGSLSDSTNYNNTSGTMIGAENQSGAVNTMYGYISNLRVVKGSGVTSLNVPTQLVNISGTSLLTCNSPAIVDQSSNNFTITANGNAAVSTFTPFQGYVAYNPALGAATPGIWTVSDAIQAAQTRRWNMYDPYFNYTTLLLHGNGTNGAQNNTFLDSSSNNFTITRNGNTTQGTFSPFSQTGWSVYGDPTGNGYLSLADNAAWDISANYTIEAWFYVAGNANTNPSSDKYWGIVSQFQDYNNMWTLGYVGDGSAGGEGLSFQTIIGGTNVVTKYTASISKNTWHHVAVTYTGSIRYLYLDGIQVASTSISSSTSNAGSLFIGRLNGGSDGYQGQYNGYISNVRIVKGSVVYTGSTFAVPTSPLTAITNTVLLTCQSNRFIDNSTNAFAITVNGTPSVQAFSPFYPVVAYTPQAQGGSGYFDGTGDYLTGPNASGGDFSTGSFTISCWFYPTTLSSGTDYGVLAYADASGWNGWQLLARGTTKDMKFEFLSGSAGVNTITGGTIVLNAWNYVVVTRSGSTVNLYVNSTTSAASATNSTAYGVSTSKVVVGADRLLSSALAGYISNVKLVKQANTPSSIPTAPDTNTTNTSLLLNYTNAGIIDSTGDNVLETVGNAQISTTQSKFGGSSMYFNGSTSYLTRPYSPLFALGSGNFTIECWINTTQNASGNFPSVVGRWSGGNSWDLRHSAGDNSGKPTFAYNDGTSNFNVASTGSTIYDGAWHHLAAVRNGNTITLYVDGTSVGTATFTGTIAAATSTPLTVGNNSGGSLYYTGYIDDLRITIGYARYTANFTPQTSQWQDQ